MSSWPTWWELLSTYLAQHRSAVAGTPLVYVMHDKDVASDEDKASNDWDSVDDDLISTYILEGNDYSCDNKHVFDLLKPFVMDGPGWPFVQPFNKSATVAQPLRH
jgi:hypothetical protein